MIRGAFHHLPGVGPCLCARLAREGVTDWSGLATVLERLPIGTKRRERLAEELGRSEAAVQSGDLQYLVEAFARADHWRILAEHLERASFFDVETDGVHRDCRITVMACLHAGRVRVWTQDEGFDEFLSLLDEVDLLVSFNGDSFDVPLLEREFHIPGLPCPHVDLRWVCYHAGWHGGLKEIERRLGFRRPPDLDGVDGAEAVRLWQHWTIDGNVWARDLLKRYCGADALALKMVAARVLDALGCSMPSGLEDWSLLGEAPVTDAVRAGGWDNPLPHVNRQRAHDRMMNLRAMLRASRANDG